MLSGETLRQIVVNGLSTIEVRRDKAVHSVMFQSDVRDADAPCQQRWTMLLLTAPVFSYINSGACWG